MEPRLVDPGYQFRPPRPHPFWAWALKPIRRRVLHKRFRVKQLDIIGGEHLAQATDNGRRSTLITPNHPAHGDPFVICESHHRLRVPCCFMASWHVFSGMFGIRGWAFQRLGAFSIDREGTDLRSFRTAVDLLVDGPHSLVIFPEGDVYHLNDKVTPLREGAAMIALSAAKRRVKSQTAPLHVVPCAIKYFYLDDPTEELLEVMTALEQRIHWRAQTHLPLPERIYRYAGAVLGLKELEYLGESKLGPLPPRINALAEHIMSSIEVRRLGKSCSEDTIPARVKNARVKVLKELGLDPATEKDGNDVPAGAAPIAAPAPAHDIIQQAQRDLNDMHLVTQLFSYPGDYVADAPTLERIAETIDKLEEDALGRLYAGARAPRRAIVQYGEPLEVASFMGSGRGAAREASGQLSAAVQAKMQALVDALQSAK